MLELLILLASEGAVLEDQRAPHRIAIERISLSGTVEETSSCAARSLNRKGLVTTYPLPNGFGLDWSPQMLFKLYPGNPSYISYEFLADDQGTYARIKYRHPYSSKIAKDFFRDTSKVCFPKDWNSWAKSNDGKLLK